ncbi:MAG: DUF1853 family protein [Cellvibrionaceae bacterium]
MNLPPLKHRASRDLAWALCSQPLFSSLPDFPENCLSQDYIDGGVLPWLEAVDKHPETLFSHLSEQRSTRLGIYFEQLLSYYFEHYPRFELLAKNLQVNGAKRTLGEFDFIVYDKVYKEVIHIEAAVKFYVGHENYNRTIKKNDPLYDWHNWIGPNQKDSLAIKMRHLKDHQLALGTTTEGKAALATLIDIKESMSSRLLVCGRFYLPQHAQITLPQYANTHKYNAFWMSSNDFIHHFSDKKKSYCLLPRQYWLSPILAEDIEENRLAIYSKKEIDEIVTTGIKQKENEWQLAEVDLTQKEYIEKKRFFILSSENLPFDKSYPVRSPTCY